MRKKENQQYEKAQRESILDEMRKQQRSREIDVGPSTISSNFDYAAIVGKSATDGVPIVDPAGLEKSDPPAS